MTPKEQIRISRFLSYVLRHKPDDIKLALDPHGWANVQDLLTRMGEHGHAVTLEQVQEVVGTDEKQRYLFAHYS